MRLCVAALDKSLRARWLGRFETSKQGEAFSSFFYEEMSDEDKDIDVESDDVRVCSHIFHCNLCFRSLFFERQIMPSAFCFDREISVKTTHSCLW